jgi:hypothetical protein
MKKRYAVVALLVVIVAAVLWQQRSRDRESGEAMSIIRCGAYWIISRSKSGVGSFPQALRVGYWPWWSS